MEATASGVSVGFGLVVSLGDLVGRTLLDGAGMAVGLGDLDDALISGVRVTPIIGDCVAVAA